MAELTTFAKLRTGAKSALISRARSGVRWLKKTHRLAGWTYDLLGVLTPFASSGDSDMPFLFSTADTGAVSRQLFSTGGHDEAGMQWSLDRLGHPEQGKTVIEVGANIGTTTVPFLGRHGAAKVIAFEPEPRNFRLLRCNLILNGVEDRVQAHQVAISDCDTSITLELAPENLGGHQVRVEESAVPEQLDESDWETISVPAFQLDTVLPEVLDDIGLVWVDTQGHEAQVLAGATRLLSQRVPWVVEYWPYGLTLAGGLERFNDLISEHFERVVDVRKSLGQGDPVELSANRIGELGYDASNPFDYTDLLLIPASGGRWPDPPSTA